MNMTPKNRDLRLYQFRAGILFKFGRGRTGLKRHFYNSLEDIKDFLESLKSSKLRGEKQFVIVEYLGPYKSKIIETININFNENVRE